MKKKEHITAFYLETLLLILVFIAIILVLTNIFGLARGQSAAAKQLTTAVALAENAAEAVAAADSVEAVAALLNTGGNARVENGQVEAGYDADLNPDSTRAPAFWVYVRWEPEGALAKATISVQRGNPWSPEPIYTLETAVYLKEVAP